MIGIHTIKPLEKGYSVGYWRYGPLENKYAIVWEEICEFAEIEDAVRRVNILNGGSDAS